jgi:hypothetical protein
LTLAPGPTVQLGGVLNQNTSVTFGGASNFSMSFGDNIGFGSSPNVRLANTAGISATQTANTQFGGSVSTPIRVVNSSYFLADDDHTVLCDNAAGLPGVVITPPAAAASNRGRIYIIKRVNSNVAGTNDNCEVANIDGIVGSVGNVVLQGPSPGTLTSDLVGVTIQSDGTQWWIVGTIVGTISARGVQGVATPVVRSNAALYEPLIGGPSAATIVPASGQLALTLTAEISGGSEANGAPCSTAFMSVSLDGPGLDPDIVLDANSLRGTGAVPGRASISVLITDLTPGILVTFTARYKNIGCLGTDGLGARFNARQIIVTPN